MENPYLANKNIQRDKSAVVDVNTDWLPLIFKFH